MHLKISRFRYKTRMLYIIPFFMIALYGVLEHVPTCTYTMDVVADVMCACMTWNAFIHGYESSYLAVPVKHPPREMIHLLQFEYGYYITYTIIDVLKHKYTSITHHVSTIIVLGAAHMFQFYHLVCALLCLFNTSTPFLSLAKLGKYQRKPWVQIPAFVCFTCVFFGGRVVGVPILLYRVSDALHPVHYGYDASYVAAWIVAKIGLGTLYAMQLIWFHRIIQIWRKNMTYRQKLQT